MSFINFKGFLASGRESPLVTLIKFFGDSKMKVRVTRKEVLSNYTNVISVGYCDLQCLLKYRDAKFYTTGVYGWNADIYEIDHDTAIVTGYRPFGNIRPICEIVKAFDGTASVCHDMDISRHQRQCLLEQLITAFISEVVR